VGESERICLSCASSDSKSLSVVNDPAITTGPLEDVGAAVVVDAVVVVVVEVVVVGAVVVVEVAAVVVVVVVGRLRRILGLTLLITASLGEEPKSDFDRAMLPWVITNVDEFFGTNFGI
jgi:hypothetical protein